MRGQAAELLFFVDGFLRSFFRPGQKNSPPLDFFPEMWYHYRQLLPERTDNHAYECLSPLHPPPAPQGGGNALSSGGHHLRLCRPGGGISAGPPGDGASERLLQRRGCPDRRRGPVGGPGGGRRIPGLQAGGGAGQPLPQCLGGDGGGLLQRGYGYAPGRRDHGDHRLLWQSPHEDPPTTTISWWTPPSPATRRTSARAAC